MVELVHQYKSMLQYTFPPNIFTYNLMGGIETS